MCGDPADPLISVGDFNANGVVDHQDVAEIAQVVGGDAYYALYDRNADGVLDGKDVSSVAQEQGASSTLLDREIALAYQRFSAFQEIEDAWLDLYPDFQPFTAAIAGHGVHWANSDAVAAITGVALSSFERPEGLNVPADGSGVWAMYWAEAATPVFEGGATDWPTPGGEWQDQRVIAFADAPPQFTSDPDELWHTHAGLCLFENPQGERELHQHTTYNECQAYEGTNPDGNGWINIWMVHMWLFELNPNGIWGGTHPCIDPWAPDEVEINDGREIPPFFQH